MGYLETSAALNINVTLAFETLAEKICKIDLTLSSLSQVQQSPVKPVVNVNVPKQSIVLQKEDSKKSKATKDKGKNKPCC